MWVCSLQTTNLRTRQKSSPHLSNHVVPLHQLTPKLFCPLCQTFYLCKMFECVQREEVLKLLRAKILSHAFTVGKLLEIGTAERKHRLAKM